MDNDFELTGGSATIRDAIRKILSNRADNSKRRYAKQARIAAKLENEERRNRILKNHPELYQKRLQREAQLKAQRRVKEAQLAGKSGTQTQKAEPKPQTQKAQKVEKVIREQIPEVVAEAVRYIAAKGKEPTPKDLEYLQDPDVREALDELGRYEIHDKKDWRKYAKLYHPDRAWERGVHADDAFDNEQFAHVMEQYEIVRKAGVPGYS